MTRGPSQGDRAELIYASFSLHPPATAVKLRATFSEFTDHLWRSAHSKGYRRAIRESLLYPDETTQ